MNRAKFIQTSIFLVGAGLFLETGDGFLYCSGFNTVWASKDLTLWSINGEYGPTPYSLAYDYVTVAD